jgi:hypothetical protein
MKKMRETLKKLETEIRDIGREEGMEKLLHLCYDDLASAWTPARHAARLRAKKIDEETADMIRRIWT